MLPFELKEHRYGENRSDPRREADQEPTVLRPKPPNPGADQKETDAQELLPEVATHARDPAPIQAEHAANAGEARPRRVVPESAPARRISEHHAARSPSLHEREQVDRTQRAGSRQDGPPGAPL